MNGGNFDLTLKCLNQIVSNLEENSRRVIVASGNPPPAAKLWRPGHLSKTLEKLGIKVEEYQQNSLATAASPQRSGHQQQQTIKETGGLNNGKQSPPVASCKPTIRSRLAGISTFNPPRKVSPPRKTSYVRPTVTSDVNTTRENRVYPPGKSSVSLYDTYEERKPVRQAPASQRLFAENQPQLKTWNQQSNERNQQSKIAKNDDDYLPTPTQDEPGRENPFRTAHQQLVINDREKGIKRNISSSGSNVHVSGLKKLAKYEPPPPAKDEKNEQEPISDNPEVVELMENPLMKNIDPKMVESILNEVLDAGSVDWHDIAGLEGVKNIIKEIILKPMLRPDIFTGLRAPPKGILLFGPPGTGKTMIGRLIATRSKFSFFNISASSLTSKWIGDGEKMVRALFAVARAKQPAVVFIDEIDSILTQRSDNEHESSRRLKTEFLIQFDGCGSKSEDRILIIGVTNRPRELDDAARRRFVKRIYIPLPDLEGRKQLVKNLIKSQKTFIDETEFDKIADMTQGYSGADMATLCQEAAYGPIRDVDVDIENISLEDVRPINIDDFETALDLVKPSVDPADLAMYEEFDKSFGCQVVKPKVPEVS